MIELVEWANDTFKATAGDPIPPAHHLQKEVKELIESLEESGPKSELTKMEYADCFILLVQSAKKAGISADELLDLAKLKFAICQKRDWGTPDQNGVYQHKN